MDPYTDFQEFMSSVPRGDSKTYYSLRAQYLTYKYTIFDFGITLVLISILATGIGKAWAGISSSLSSKAKVVWAALTLPFVFCLFFVIELFQYILRGEVPSWADTPAIPLMSVPVIFVAVGIFTTTHLIFLPKQHPGSVLTIRLLSRAINPLLAFSLVLTSLITLLFWLSLEPLFAFPLSLTTYFIASITSARVVSKGIKTQSIQRPET